MISFLEGNIKKFLLNPKRLILLVNGVGYEIHIPEYLSNFFVENSIIETLNSYKIKSFSKLNYSLILNSNLVVISTSTNA